MAPLAESPQLAAMKIGVASDTAHRRFAEAERLVTGGTRCRSMLSAQRKCRAVMIELERTAQNGPRLGGVTPFARDPERSVGRLLCLCPDSANHRNDAGERNHAEYCPPKAGQHRAQSATPFRLAVDANSSDPGLRNPRSSPLSASPSGSQRTRWGSLHTDVRRLRGLSLWDGSCHTGPSHACRPGGTGYSHGRTTRGSIGPPSGTLHSFWSSGGQIDRHGYRDGNPCTPSLRRAETQTQVSTPCGTGYREGPGVPP
jgi:hypothetical protein